MDVKEYYSAVSGEIAAFKSTYPNKVYSDVTDAKGNQYVDLAMEGGGVLGLALVGYTYALEQVGIRFWRIGGASAGAINAMMLATGSPFGEPASESVLDALSTLNIADFIDGNFFSRAFVKHCVLGKGLERLLYGILLTIPLAIIVARKKGLNPGDKFAEWIRNFLKAHRTPNAQSSTSLSSLLDSIRIGSDLRYFETPITQVYPKPRLAVVASEVTTQTKVQFPLMAPMYWANDADADPAFFVRASMSIPIFFRPFVAAKLPTGDEAKKRWTELGSYYGVPPASCTFVDGGIMSNFPISLFHTQNNLVPRAPTFGGRLNKKDRVEQPTNHLLQFIGAIFNTSRHTLDFDFLMNHPDYQNLIAYIDTGDQNWLNFYLTDADKLDLFKRGVRSALDFLTTFDWAAYKQIRSGLGDNQPWPGFPLQNIPASAVTTSA